MVEIMTKYQCGNCYRVCLDLYSVMYRCDDCWIDEAREKAILYREIADNLNRYLRVALKNHEDFKGRGENNV